ncbi:hypothetical protein BDP27DRAFT_1417054 [Rhodocollybia butyracea]|uniref:C2H2-type domain-containing protein n=1 Tax=Rhodocollybia butyracea TaxID=206335 RepID=A0A9P5UB02_9AGAR|nr:hypothetical protein BDP27DRAFT_1417054 [Rhodocollybia butyracea]
MSPSPLCGSLPYLEGLSNFDSLGSQYAQQCFQQTLLFDSNLSSYWEDDSPAIDTFSPLSDVSTLRSPDSSVTDVESPGSSVISLKSSPEGGLFYGVAANSSPQSISSPPLGTPLEEFNSDFLFHHLVPSSHQESYLEEAVNAALKSFPSENIALSQSPSLQLPIVASIELPESSTISSFTGPHRSELQINWMDDLEDEGFSPSLPLCPPPPTPHHAHWPRPSSPIVALLGKSASSASSSHSAPAHEPVIAGPSKRKRSVPPLNGEEDAFRDIISDYPRKAKKNVSYREQDLEGVESPDEYNEESSDSDAEIIPKKKKRCVRSQARESRQSVVAPPKPSKGKRRISRPSGAKQSNGRNTSDVLSNRIPDGSSHSSKAGGLPKQRTKSSPSNDDERHFCNRGRCVNKEFTRKHDLVRHKESVHDNNGNRFVCDTCKHSLSRRDALQRHIRTHSPEKAIPKPRTPRKKAPT